MKIKNLLLGGVLVAVLVGSGHFLYRLGAQQAVRTNPAVSSASGAAMEGAVATADPSNWGIPEGEAATRRHMASGVRAGVVDPLTGRQVLYYHDPMVPGKQFEVPGKSPFMDMMLVPAYAGSEGADSGTVRVSPRIQQNLGLRSAVATEGALVPAVRAVGAIAWNERDQAVVQARALAYVERLHVRAVLDPVQKGQALAELYVPDWVAAQQEFLTVRRMPGRDLAALVDAARSRMRQAGMDEAQIHRVESSGEVQARVTLRSPLTGVLTELMVSEGTTLMPGMGVVRINGVSTVWAHAEVPESQLALLQPGARVVAQTPALAGQSFEGRVAALLPQVNPKTRTLKVRMEIANPRGQLVPGMFVQMELAGQATERAVLVPTEAVIQTGKRSLVMLAEEQGRFRPVEVEIGTESGGQTEIRRGLTAGQRVVLSGQFLIDSEASLKGVEARLNPGQSALEPQPETTAAAVHTTRARIEAMDGKTLTLSHPPIPSLRWPAMRMDFQLAPKLSPSTLAVGQTVEIEFRMQDGEVPLIESLRRDEAAPAVGGLK